MFISQGNYEKGRDKLTVKLILGINKIRFQSEQCTETAEF
jgi:hypothetical protein